MNLQSVLVRVFNGPLSTLPDLTFVCCNGRITFSWHTWSLFSEVLCEACSVVYGIVKTLAAI